MQAGMEAMRTEVSELLEKFSLMMKKWDGLERDRKEKGVETNSPGTTTNQDNPLASQGSGENTEFRGRRDEGDQGGMGGRRLEMPMFNGEDPDGWIFRAERYFNMNRLGNWERVEAAVVCFEGEALAWYQWEESQQPMRTWEDMKLLMLDRFRTSQEGTALEKFLALKQEGTMKDYRRMFEMLAGPLQRFPNQ